MLRLLCLALLLPACTATECLSASFQDEPTGPLTWAPDSDVGWVHHELPGDPPGDLLKIDPIDTAQITVIPSGPLPTQALRIAALGVASPVSLRAVPEGAPLHTGTITVSFAGRFEAPEGGFTPDVQWMLVASDVNDEVLGGLQLSNEAGEAVLTYGAGEFFYTDPDLPAAVPTRPFALVAEFHLAARRVVITLISDGHTVVSGEELDFSVSAASNVATLAFWGTEGTLVLDEVQVWQE